MFTTLNRPIVLRMEGTDVLFVETHCLDDSRYVLIVKFKTRVSEKGLRKAMAIKNLINQGFCDRFRGLVSDGRQFDALGQ